MSIFSNKVEGSQETSNGVYSQGSRRVLSNSNDRSPRFLSGRTQSDGSGSYETSIIPATEVPSNTVTRSWAKNLLKLVNVVQSDSISFKDSHCRSFLIGSFKSGDGATTICDNLMWSLNETDCTKKPILLRVINTPEEGSINLDLLDRNAVNFLLENSDNHDVQRVNLVIPDIPSANIAIVSRFKDLLSKISANYQCIIVDAPSFDSNSISFALGQSVDATMVVANQTRHSEEDIEGLTEELSDYDINFIGFIVNFTDPAKGV